MNKQARKDLNKIIKAVTLGTEPVDWTEVAGFIVSTILTGDCGYETAILDALGFAYPVERYKTLKLAEQGHQQWIKKCQDGLKEVTRLGYGPGSSVPDRVVTLSPRKG